MFGFLCRVLVLDLFVGFRFGTLVYFVSLRMFSWFGMGTLGFTFWFGFCYFVGWGGLMLNLFCWVWVCFGFVFPLGYLL